MIGMVGLDQHGTGFERATGTAGNLDQELGETFLGALPEAQVEEQLAKLRANNA